MPVAKSFRRWIPALAVAILAAVLLLRTRPEPGAAPQATLPAARPATTEVSISAADAPEALADGAWAHAARGADFRCGSAGVDVEVFAGALRISTRELRIGDRVLYREGTEVRPILAADKAVVYRRSADLEERFLPRPAGMEQLWVLDKDVDVLKGAGELSIRVSLETSLEARPHAVEDGSQAIRFYTPEGEAVLEYGAATAIDAEGKTRKLDYRLESGGLHMALDAGWLAQASFPLTIDPVVGTPITVDNNAPVSSIRPLDVAYNATNNQWLITWSENNDIAIRIMNANGSFTGNRRRIAGGAAQQVEPAVAWNAATNRYLVVYSNLGNGNGAIRVIMGQILDADGSNFGNRFPISNALLRNRRHPDVAASGNEWLVTWDEETTPTNLDVFARMVQASYDPTQALASAQFPVASLPANELTPAVSALTVTGTWMLLWEEAGAIKGRTTNATGTLGTLRSYGSSPASWPDLAAGPTGTCLAVWNSSVLGNNDVYAVPVGADGLMQATAPRAMTVSTDQQLYPKAAYSATVGQYLVTWQRQILSANDLYGARLWANGGQVTGSEGVIDGFAQPTPTPDDRYPAVAWNSASNEMLIAYRSNASTPFLINAQRFSMAYDGPANPSLPDQNRTTGGAQVAVGLYTNELTLNLRATSSDPNVGGTFKMQFQVRPIGTAMTYPLAPVIDNVTFFETPYTTNPNGNAAQALTTTVTGLVNATSYHWLARAVDDTGLASSWVEFPLPANASNPPSSPAAADFIVDTVPPTISISAPSFPLTRVGPVSYTVTYGGADFVTLSAANITLNATGTATGTITVSVVDPVTRTVTISPTSGTGTLGISIVAGTASDLATNLAPAAGPSLLFDVDNTPPTLAIVGPSAVATTTGPISYTVNYSGADAVTLADANVTLVATGTAAGSVAVSGVGLTSRTVTISSISGNGTLAISIASGTASDTAGNLAAASGTSASFSVDNMAPLISIGAPLPNSTKGGPVDFTVTYTGADFVTLIDTNVTLNSTLTASGTVTVLGSGNLSRTVRISGITGDGTLGITIAPGTASDNGGNFAAGAGPSGTFTVDNTPPSIVIGPPSAGSTKAGPVSFPVTYSGATLVNLLAGNITLNSTGGANGVIGVTGGGTSTPTVTISGITGDGTLAFTIGAGSASDALGNMALATGPSASFIVDNTPPSILISGPSQPATNTGPITYTVTYGGPATVNLLPGNITLNPSNVGVTGNVSVTNGTTLTPTVTISGISGNGTLGFSIGANTAFDSLGNQALAAGPSTTFVVDNIPPSIVIGAPSAAFTAGGPVSFPITYSGADSVNLLLGNISLDSTGGATGTIGLAGGTTSTPVVTITGISGNGTLGISIAASTASDLAGNVAPAAGPSTTFVVDNIPPSIVIVGPSIPLTKTGPVSFTVNYGGADTVNLVPANITLNSGGTATGSVGVVVTNPTSALVTISSITGDGPLGISITASTAFDNAGNLAPAAGPSATFMVDNTPPSIVIGSPSLALTNSGPVSFSVTYSGATTVNLTLADISLAPTGNATGSIVVTNGNTTTPTVTINGISGDGTLAINIGANTAVDGLGNQALAVGPSASFNVDNTPPTIVIGAPTTALTNTGPVNFPVTYSGATTVNLTLADISLNSTGGASGTISLVNGNTPNPTVTISTITGDGTLGISIAAGTASDAATNTAPAAASTTFAVDNTPPTLVIGPPSSSSTNSGPVNFAVTYSGATTVNLTLADISLNSTGGASGVISLVNGNTPNPTVTISTITGNGTLGISIGAGTASDAATNTAPAPAPSATFLVDNMAPTISISPPSATLTRNANVTFTVTYGGASNITLLPSQITLDKTSSADGVVLVAVTNPTSALVTISGITGDGTLGISIAAGTAVDAAGNAAPAAGPSGTFTVDNTAPTIQISAPVPAVTATTSVVYTVTYSGADSVTLVDANVTVVGIGASATAAVTGSGTGPYTVTLSNVSGNGTLAISIAVGTASDTAGNQALASGTSATANVDNLPPTVLITGPSVGSTATGPVTYTVTYGGASSITLSTVTLQSVGTAAGSVGVVVTNPTSALVTISGITGDGLLRILVPAGSAVDAAGNLAPAAGPSAAVVVDDPASNILAPSALRVNGALNPTAVADTPAFTAVHNWSGGTPLDAGSFQLQVSTSPTFATVTHWNSPPQTIFPGAVLVAAGSGSPDLRYSFGGNLTPPVPLLSWNTTYWWRLKFWDTNNAESPFSTEVATFRMGIPSAVVSANGNGSPTTTGWHMIGLPIPVGTSVSAAQLMDDVVQILRMDEPTRTWILVPPAGTLTGGKSYLVWAAPAVVADLLIGNVSLGGQQLVDLSYTTLAAATGQEVTEGRAANYYRGGHILANPFNRTISWEDPVNGGQVEKLNLSPTYYKWDGAQYIVYNSQTHAGAAGPLIPPFQGFGVNVLSDNGPATDVVIHDSFFAPSLAPRRSLARQEAAPSEAWSLQIVAESGSARDTENLAGVHPDADDAWDLRDSEEPGAGPDLFVLVSFDHEEWPTNPRGYTHDIRRTRSEPGEEVSWTLSVRSNTGSPVRLTWPNLGEIPSSDWSLTLEDPNSGLKVDLASTSWLDLPPLAKPITLVLHATRLSAGGGDPAPTPDPVAAAGAGGDDGRCGLLGVEFLLILAVLRRRRSALAATRECR